MFHINALFDLENGIYTDVIVQKEHTKHESRALREMAVRSVITDPVIVLADRNYEAYNNFACLEKRGWKYLIRIKDHERKNAYGLKLPDEPEFDLPIRMTLGRLTPQQLRQQGILVPEHYYRLPNSIPFDFLDAESTAFYEFSARIVRLTLKDGRTQLLITNLDAAWDTDENCGHSKYKRRVNFAHAVYLCCKALRGKSAEITGLLERTLTPRRPDRFYPRPKITGNRLSAMYVSAR